MERGKNTTVIRSSAAPCAQTRVPADDLSTCNVITHHEEQVCGLAGRLLLKKVDFRYRYTHIRTFRIPSEEDTSMLKHLRWEQPVVWTNAEQHILLFPVNMHSMYWDLFRLYSSVRRRSFFPVFLPRNHVFLHSQAKFIIKKDTISVFLRRKMIKNAKIP